MDRTYFHVDRVENHWAVHVEGARLPVAFAERADAVSAALDIARSKWELGGEPTAVTFPVSGEVSDVLLFGGDCNDDEE